MCCLSEHWSQKLWPYSFHVHHITNPPPSCSWGFCISARLINYGRRYHWSIRDPAKIPRHYRAREWTLLILISTLDHIHIKHMYYSSSVVQWCLQCICQYSILWIFKTPNRSCSFIYILYCEMNIKHIFPESTSFKRREQVCSTLKCKYDISKSMDKKRFFFLHLCKQARQGFSM